MRKILVTIAATLALALVAATALAENVITTIAVRPAGKTVHSLGVWEDGTVVLDGQPVESLSRDDIKAILAEMVAEVTTANRNEQEKQYLYRQTNYLLGELQKCQEGK